MNEPAADPLRILVVDDSATVRRFLTAAIAEVEPNATCIEAADGPDCIDKMSRHDIDIAFVDVNMPQLSGIDAVAKARSTGIDAFVVIMSTEWSPEKIEQARALNVYEYLTKPFQPADIAAIVANYRRFRKPSSVLLVDDSSATRSVIKRVFADSIFNLQIDEAEDGPSALVMYQSGRHDIVFLDINMPGINGLDTLEMLRKLNERVKFVLITSDRSEALANSLEAGMAQSLLYKPFFKEDVDRVLHDLFDLRAPTFGEGEDGTGDDREVAYL